MSQFLAFDLNNREDFEEVYRRHFAVVFGVRFRYCGNSMDAEDLAHDTFIRCYERFEGFRGQAASGQVLGYLRGLEEKIGLNGSG